MTNPDLLRKVPLFSDLPDAEIESLAASLRVVTVGEREVLFRENEPGESLYVILDGGVDVLLALETTEEKTIASLGPGEFIGEMSLMLPGGARTAGARSNAPSRLWEITRADFDALLGRQPSLAHGMVRTMAGRLDTTNNAAFRDLQEKNRQLQQAYDELKAAQAQLIEKERLERELQVAAEIQTGILPQELPRLPGYDFGALMVPARMVGGDFYDVFLLDRGRAGFVIGDVADKGIPSAIFMARTHALIMAEVSHGGSPADVLRSVNHHLVRLEQSSQFVTVILGVLDPQTGLLTYARAGHELPLLLTSGGTVETLPHTNGQAVGMFDDLLLDEQSLTLPPGGTLLLFTDGMTDCRSQQGEALEHERLRTILGGLAVRNGQEVCNALLEALQKYQCGAPQDDDITLVAVHRQ
jgi:sigma-B regulation protein RsbU (phosphoserine phosphatase)